MGVAVGNMIEPFVNKEFHMCKLFAGLLRPLETVSKTSHKFEVNVFNNRKIHKVFAQSRSI